VKVYMDGSGMQGKIGAAEVLYCNGRMKTNMQYKLGAQEHHTVYKGKGIGVVLGARLISQEWGVWSATFCIDSQAIIKATQLTKPSPRHYIIDAFHRTLDMLRKKHPGIWITIRWTPGHKGIEGNE
jgi:hypothetical protein